MTRRLARVSHCGIVLGLITLAGARGNASDRSVVAFSQGIELFRAERFEEARLQFETAVEADPNDVEALYYRGVTRGRVGLWKGAIEDLTLVVTARPEFNQAVLELGIAYVGGDHPEQAVSWLERVVQLPEFASTASFFLGLAHWRANAPARAQPYFEAAAKSAEHAVASRYYLGLMAFYGNDWTQSAVHFEYVAATSPDSQMGREARAFLERLHGLTTRYQLYGEIGIDYDSNVVLAPTDDAARSELAISGQEDGRVNITAGGRYVPWRTGNMELSLGYEFYQGLQFNLTDFNLQDHRPWFHFVFSNDAVSAGILTRYDYYRLETDSLLQQGVVLPWVRVATASVGYAELSYRMRRQDYLDDTFGPRLDSINHAPAFRQVFYLGAAQRELYLGYRFDSQDAIHTSGQPFAYNGQQAEAGVRWAAPHDAATAELGYRFHYEKYDSASDGRRDDEHSVYLSCRKRLHDMLALRLSYLGIFNGSTQKEFEYNRHIVGLAVEVSFP